MEYGSFFGVKNSMRVFFFSFFHSIFFQKKKKWKYVFGLTKSNEVEIFGGKRKFDMNISVMQFFNWQINQNE